MEKLALMSAKQKYEQDGYVVFNNVLDSDLMQEAKEHTEWLMAKYPGVRPENLGKE